MYFDVNKTDVCPLARIQILNPLYSISYVLYTQPQTGSHFEYWRISTENVDYFVHPKYNLIPWACNEPNHH